MKLLTKKGYLQIDFLFVLLCFFVIFSFVYTTYSQRYDAQVSHLETREQQEILHQLCNILSTTPGVPNDWNATSLASTSTIGLLEENTSNVDSTKINTFFNESNYLEIYNHYNLTSLFYGKLSNTSGSVLMSFGEQPQLNSVIISSKCFLKNTSGLYQLELGVWE
ncbi:MAG: hypothetical protein VX028_03600 [Nanoarchaeota archaeon]|nr:hypothetical protein [Nanoarchaeota archaeon]